MHERSNNPAALRILVLKDQNSNSAAGSYSRAVCKLHRLDELAIQLGKDCRAEAA